MNWGLLIAEDGGDQKSASQTQDVKRCWTSKPGETLEILNFSLPPVTQVRSFCSVASSGNLALGRKPLSPSSVQQMAIQPSAPWWPNTENNFLWEDFVQPNLWVKFPKGSGEKPKIMRKSSNSGEPMRSALSQLLHSLNQVLLGRVTKPSYRLPDHMTHSAPTILSRSFATQYACLCHLGEVTSTLFFFFLSGLPFNLWRLSEYREVESWTQNSRVVGKAWRLLPRKQNMWRMYLREQIGHKLELFPYLVQSAFIWNLSLLNLSPSVKIPFWSCFSEQATDRCFTLCAILSFQIPFKTELRMSDHKRSCPALEFPSL